MLIYRFRNCLLNTIERTVIKEDQYVDLTTKNFDVLLYLVENAGKVVTKDELLGAVWGGDCVEESNLPVHVSKLRKSLEKTRAERYIETIQGVGYRFLSQVDIIEVDEWNQTLQRIQNRDRTSSRPQVTSGSIAVLPLRNVGRDSSLDYIVDGITEGLINGLSYIPGLTVIAREAVFRYKDIEVDLAEAGELLGVSRLVTGRVRLAGEQLSISVELVTIPGLVQVWGDQFDRPFSEVIPIQQAIVGIVAARLSTPVIQRECISLTSTENAESYRSYLMGMYLLRKKTTSELYKAIDHFRRSVVLCPTNVHSYVGIVESYYLLHALDRIDRSETLRNIRPVLDKLEKIKQSLDVVHLMSGKLSLSMDWDTAAAERHFREALRINPNSISAHGRLAEVMIVINRKAEALFHATRMLALDPISLFSLKQVGRLFYMLDLHEDAIPYLSDALEMESQDPETMLILGAALAEIREYRQAISHLQSSYRIHANIEALSMIGYVRGLAGDVAGARSTIERIESELKNHSSHSINLARIYMVIGETDKAYRLLNEAYDQRSVDLYGLEADPRWKRIRTDSRFVELTNRVNNSGGSVD